MPQYDQYQAGYNQQNNYIGAQQAQARQMGLLGDQMRDPNSANNQFNLRQMSSQFNAGQPNYFEIAASQGIGGGLAGMQQAAGKRQAGLLTNANYGSMMNDNQKTALSYYGQQQQGMQGAQTAQQGLLGMDFNNKQLDYQDRWKADELAEQRRQFNESQTDPWMTLLGGVGGSLLGGLTGGLGSGLASKILKG